MIQMPRRPAPLAAIGSS